MNRAIRPLSLFRAGKVRSAEADRAPGASRFADRGVLLIIAIVVMPVGLLIVLAGLGWI